MRFFERVELNGCKAVGANFSETGWRDAYWRDCRLSDAVFDRARLRRVMVLGCDLTGASFCDCQWKNWTLEHTALRSTRFLHTPLMGLDLTGCELDGLAVSDTNAELRGAVVTMEQAAMLAKRLGLVIKA